MSVLYIARSIFDFIPSSSKLTKVTAAELSLVYHGVRHGHSYRSQSCTADLLRTICDDSDIGQHVRCGKTKSRQLSVNILGRLMLFVIFLIRKFTDKKALRVFF